MTYKSYNIFVKTEFIAYTKIDNINNVIQKLYNSEMLVYYPNQLI